MTHGPPTPPAIAMLALSPYSRLPFHLARFPLSGDGVLLSSGVRGNLKDHAAKPVVSQKKRTVIANHYIQCVISRHSLLETYSICNL
jgi:hypothetical protein